MTLAAGARPADDFPIEWEEPADPGRSWAWDDMHMPFALRPLAQDYTRTLGAGFNLCYEIFGGFPQRTLVRTWNGYAYFAHDANVPEAEREALNKRWLRVMRDRADVTAAYWADEVLPEVRALERAIRTVDVEGLPAEELAEAWDAAWTAIARMWQLHFCIILGPYTILEELADLYEATVTGAAPGESLRLIQGVRHELFETEVGVERLTAAADRSPAVRRRLLEATTDDPAGHRAVERTELATLDGGAAFVAQLDGFLAEHGHMGQGFDDLGNPSWGEEPAILLAEIGRRLAEPPADAEARRTRLAAEADQLADTVRERLRGRPEERERFETVLALSREVGPLTEVHNYWIDRMAQARIRALSIRVGARLAAVSCLDAPDDVLYLHRPEIRELIEHPADRRALVAERRAIHARQAALKPPAFVGAPRRSSEPDRFDGAARVSDEADVLLGTGASAGIVRGPARVTLSPADFGRIRAGDVIVCPSSNPSWVPVFTLAAGLVTNTGGILSHAAVVAREFGLPAVVGVGDATTRIADGREVEIDGTTGSVRLL
ncbi:MAG: hypothetical protein HY264_00715 [Chloroflexi bacterium]|nr:hypothetical protein [Chloroflexota bacterium]